MRHPIVAAVAWLAMVRPLAAQEPLVNEGFDHFYNLEYEEALADFGQAVVQNPDAPELHNYLAETLVFREMFRDGALESELVSGENSFLRRPNLNPTAETEQRLLRELTRAMILSNARLRQNPRDTSALYALGISYGIRANYYWVVKKAWRDSLSDAASARRLHNRITELDPGNVDAHLVQASTITLPVACHWSTGCSGCSPVFAATKKKASGLFSTWPRMAGSTTRMRKSFWARSIAGKTGRTTPYR